MNNIASIFIEKSINGQVINIHQIGIVFIKDNKFKFFCKYIKNEVKKSNNAIDLEEVTPMIEKILESKKVILKNDDNNDFSILNRTYLRYLKKPFSNVFYDVAKNSHFLGMKKSNLDFLSKKYGADFKNVKELPSSVFKAQKLFVIGTKMFNLGEINGK